LNPHIRHPRTRIPNAVAGGDPNADDGEARLVPDDPVLLPVMPDVQQLLLLASYDIFVRLGVATAVYEVYVGGLRDVTNVFERTCAAVFTPIGVDHERLLGRSPLHVAWHKSGIMRLGTPVFIGPQANGAARFWLEWNAADLNCPVEFPAPTDPDVSALLPPGAADDGGDDDDDHHRHRHPRLVPRVQLWNAALAVRVAARYLAACGARLSRRDVLDGLDTLQPDARFHVVERPAEPGVTWFFDVAHNTMSLPVAAAWFASQTRRAGEGEAVAASSSSPSPSPSSCPPAIRRVLVFGFNTKRDPAAMTASLFGTLAAAGVALDLVVLSPFEQTQDPQDHVASANARIVPVVRQHAPAQEIVVAPTIGESIAAATRREVGGDSGGGGGPRVHVFVVGSFHLVAGVWAEWQGVQVE
jgi:folylpolyglutamate synthase